MKFQKQNIAKQDLICITVDKNHLLENQPLLKTLELHVIASGRFHYSWLLLTL